MLVFTKRFLHFFQLWGVWTVRSSDHAVKANIQHLGAEDGHLLSAAALPDGLDFVGNGEFGLFTPRTAHTEDLQVGLSKQIFWKWCHSDNRNNADSNSNNDNNDGKINDYNNNIIIIISIIIIIILLLLLLLFFIIIQTIIGKL